MSEDHTYTSHQVSFVDKWDIYTVGLDSILEQRDHTYILIAAKDGGLVKKAK